MSCLSILEINPFSVASFANIFSYSMGCLFILFMVPFAVQKLLFTFILISLENESKKTLLWFSQRVFWLYFPLTISDLTFMWPSNPAPGHIPRENHSLKLSMHSSVHCSSVYNSQDMEQPPCPRTDEWLKMWGITQCVSFSRNKTMAFAATRDLQIIIQSEISQTKKNITWCHLHVESNKNELTKI